MVAKKKDHLAETVEGAVKAALKQVEEQKDMDMETKLKIIDRGLKLVAIKAKIADEDLGKGFRDEETE